MRRLSSLNCSFDVPPTTVHRICGDRILARGDKHQSLIADETKAHKDMLWQFLRSAEDKIFGSNSLMVARNLRASALSMSIETVD